MTAARARRLCLTTVQRLDRLHRLAVESMYRTEPGTKERWVRTERQVAIALWLTQANAAAQANADAEADHSCQLYVPDDSNDLLVLDGVW